MNFMKMLDKWGIDRKNNEKKKKMDRNESYCMKLKIASILMPSYGSLCLFFFLLFNIKLHAVQT